MQTSLGMNELYLAVALMIGFIICWSVMFVSLRGKDEIFKILYAEGNLLRMLAVVCIVVAVAFLSLVGKVSGEASITIFSGIAGYVLGGISKKSSL